MFLRWKSRKRNRPEFGSWVHGPDEPDGSNIFYRRMESGEPVQDVHWAAILVESYREDGKPRQRHVGYLGGITESRATIVNHRGHFWVDAMEKLDRMADRISDRERAAIEAKLAEKVPPLTEAEIEGAVGSLEKYEERWATSFARLKSLRPAN